MMKMAEVMSGNPLPDAVRPAIEQRAKDEGRVAIRVSPSEFFMTRPIGSK